MRFKSPEEQMAAAKYVNKFGQFLVDPNYKYTNPNYVTVHTGSPGAVQGQPITWTAASSVNTTITHATIYDAATGGNPIMNVDLATPVTIGKDDTFTIEADGITISTI